MPVASSCSALGVSQLPYILPQHLLRVSQKAKSHLETVNEPVFSHCAVRDECGHWAGGVKGQGRLHLGWKMIPKGLSVRDRACKAWTGSQRA